MLEYGTLPSHADLTKEATAEYYYAFSGWTPVLKAVTKDVTYKAIFQATKVRYTITWKNEDGSVIDTTVVEYGAMPTHEDVRKASDDQYSYFFIGWSPKLTAVTQDAEYTATFMPLVIHDKGTEAPTEVPTEAPTEAPTAAPTKAPTEVPTEAAPTPEVPEKPDYTGLWIAIILGSAALLSGAAILILVLARKKRQNKQ